MCIRVENEHKEKRRHKRVEDVAAGGNLTPPQTPAAGVQVPVNLVVLTDGEVREPLVHVAQAITTQAHATLPRPLERVLPGITHMLIPWLAD